MKKFRPVEEILSPSEPHMVGDGFKVVNYYPNGKNFSDRMSPFFLMDFNPEFNFSPTDFPRGVGVHPHRGFETVTIAYKGSVAHNDSAGNSGVINPGDVQWMTAASGILHKEYHEKEFAEKGGAFEMVQLWVNLPKKYKMASPHYQAILHEQKGKIDLPANAGKAYIIAGEYNGIKGAAKTFSPVELYDIRLNENGEIELNVPAEYNTGLLVVEGEVTINQNAIASQHQYAQFKNEDGLIKIKATRKSNILFLSGEPINEPVAAYGPFVMNTFEEIQQALSDVKSGKFGTLAN
ncbi:MAG: pirin family protein [Bacteroidota bacterium]|nr:pirin family protein [Bacteroidota bacterium]